MSIFEDAQKGALVGRKLDRYIRDKPDILSEFDPATGWTPLATAVVGGFPDSVKDLIKKGADAGGLSRDGETPLLLAAWKTEKERPLIIHILLKHAPQLVNATCRAAGNKTPLMFAVEKQDLFSIRELRKLGASLDIKSDDGFTAEEMAKALPNRRVLLALGGEMTVLATLASIILNFILYVLAYADMFFRGAIRHASKWNPAKFFSLKTHEQVNPGREPVTADEFVQNVDGFVKDKPLQRFFKNRPDFIQTLARKATELSKNPNTDLGSEALLPKTIQVSLHQQVIYCDDSGSMKRERRWTGQQELVKRIAKITTLVLPEDEGVALRFINQEVDNSFNLDLKAIENIITPLSWHPGGNTPIGTSLRSKILKPLVYDKLETNTFERPLLVSIITDGIPEPEPRDTLVNAIIECGKKLEENGWPKESVKFMIGQVGTADAATRFLDTLRSNDAIRPVTFVTSDRLDAKFTEFNENTRELDRWLIETLFSPMQSAETKKDV